MLADSIRSHTLCDELQLGGQLNSCTHQGNKAAFHLMLSMLSPNVCDQPQFDMVKPGPAEQTLSLRQRFQLAEPRSLEAQPQDYAREASFAPLSQESSLASIRLQHALQAGPLHANTDIAGVDAEVMNNVELLTRVKQQLRFDMQTENKQVALAAQASADKAVSDEVIGSEMYRVMTDFDYDKPLKLHSYA